MAREIILMPEKLNLLTQVSLQSIKDILVVTGARKDDYTPTHGLSLNLKPIVFNDRIREQFLAHLADPGLGHFTGTGFNSEFEIFPHPDILYFTIAQGVERSLDRFPLGI
jgi:hypothetical protein